LRLIYDCQGEVPSTIRAYAKVQVPGTYSVTVTHPEEFRGYLLDQLGPLLSDYTVRLEVGLSEQNIPYPYVVEQGDELAGSGVTAAELARVFPSTDLSAASDGTADGLYDWENIDPLPLALFDAEGKPLAANQMATAIMGPAGTLVHLHASAAAALSDANLKNRLTVEPS